MPGSGLVFDNTYDPSCTSQYIACVVAAEEQLESLFTNSDTINATFVEASTAPTKTNPNPFALSNNAAGNTYSYSQLESALAAAAPGDNLPTTDPSGGANWWAPDAWARMVGLTSNTNSTDITVTLNTYYSWDFGQDVINGVTHELSEGGLGRVGGLGGDKVPFDNSGTWSAMDLFRVNASGVPDYSNGRDGVTTYFGNSGLLVDGSSISDQDLPAKGAPTLSFNNQYNSDGSFNNGGDTDDWNQNQVFGSTGKGETFTLTQTELDVLQALGWTLSMQQDVDSTTGAWETPNGSFTNWSTGSMPIEAQDAYIDSATVSLNSNVIVNSIATSSSALLLIGENSPTTLTAVEGTVLNTADTGSTASGNEGDTFVYAGSALQIGTVDQTFDNANTLGIGKGAGVSGGYGDLNIAGTITLNGGGTVTLGQSGSSGTTGGEIQNAPDGKGGTVNGALDNVDNTIETGSGSLDDFINLGLGFDNETSGKVESASFLQIIAPSLTNEGTMTAEKNSTLELSDGGGGGVTFTNSGVLNADPGATLDLGGDGLTETLTNTGTINIGVNGSANLAVSGNLTLAGSGTLALKGAGADIASDGFFGTTFTNDSTIDAIVSSQIGDADLTFVNDGTAGATISGATLTIDTDGNTVTNGSGGTIEAKGGATVAIVSDVTNNGVMEAGPTDSSSTGTLDLGKDGATRSMNDTGAVAIYAKSDLAISGSYTITGGGAVEFKGAGGDITSDGNGAATLTNDSTIEALASGQIGDEGIKGSNDLTFVNDGTTGPDGSGVTLTINTGGNSVTNESGGTLEAINGATLAILSELINNGTIDAGATGASPSSGTVDLGLDGATRSMTNNKVVGVYANSDLAISGNYTVTGSGDIGIKGAGGDITSDGKAAATLTNESTIEAVASGQLGDEGIKASNDLTFDNTGTVVAAFSGVTLTLNTGGNTINDGGGLLEAESSATLTIDSTVDTGVVSGTAGTVEAGSAGTVILDATIQDGLVGPSVTGQVVIDGGTFEMESGASVTVPIKFEGSPAGTLEILGVASVTVSGSNGDITAVAGDTITLTSGTADTITGKGFTVDLSAGTQVTVGGNGAAGTADVVNGSNASVTVQASSHVSLIGSSDTGSMGAGSNLTISGSNDTITATTGDGIRLLSGTGDTIDGASYAVVAANNLGFTINGAGGVVFGGTSDTITLGASSTMNLEGSSDTVAAASGDAIALKTGTSDTVTGAGVVVYPSAGTGVTVGGNGPAGKVDVVVGSNATVGVEASSHATLFGSTDAVTIGSSSNVAIDGSTNTVTAAAGDQITLVSGTGDTFSGNGFAAQGDSGVSFTIKGTGDLAYAGLNDVITDSGASTLIRILGNVGSLKISSFGSDASGVIDLLNGVGGYGTAAAAFAALTSDGSGGSKLSLGADGTIDIANDPPASLKVSNFKIG